MRKGQNPPFRHHTLGDVLTCSVGANFRSLLSCEPARSQRRWHPLAHGGKPSSLTRPGPQRLKGKLDCKNIAIKLPFLFWVSCVGQKPLISWYLRGKRITKSYETKAAMLTALLKFIFWSLDISCKQEALCKLSYVYLLAWQINSDKIDKAFFKLWGHD